MTLLAKINETAAFLNGKGMEAPEFGLILDQVLENWLKKSKIQS